MMCSQCKFYIRHESDLESNDKCSHPKSSHSTGGIRTNSEVIYFTCYAMLGGMCDDHKLWQPRLEVA